MGNTEYAYFTNRGADKIDLNEVYLYDEFSMISEDSLFNGSFQPLASTKIVITRISHGILFLEFIAEPGKSTGRFLDEKDRFLWNGGDITEIYFENIDDRSKNGQTIKFTIRSDSINIGINPVEQKGTNAMLRSGHVQMLGESFLSIFFGREYFQAGFSELKEGYQFRIKEHKGIANGFVLVNEKPGVFISYRQSGKEGVVVPPGPSVSFESDGFPIYVSFLDRLLYDTFFKSVSILFGFLAIIAAFITLIIEYKSYYSKNKSMKFTGKRRWQYSPRNRIHILIFFLFIGFSYTKPVKAQELVNIEGGSIGKGFIRSNGEKCYLITAFHVVDGYATTWQLTNRKAETIEVTIDEIEDYEPDIAIIEITDDVQGDCEVFSDLKEFDEVLFTYNHGSLMHVDKNGNLNNIPVYFKQKNAEFIIIQPVFDGPKDELKPGLSGSMVFVNHHGKQELVGMFLELDDKDQDLGRVFRMDKINRLLMNYFPEVKPTMDIETAQKILDRAILNKDGADQGQVQAIKALIDADLSFQNADLSGVSLKTADLRNALFQGAKLDASDLSEVNGSNINLSRADLIFANISNADFRQGNLSEAYLPFVIGEKVNFEQADLKKANFFGSDLRNANFQEANLSNASLSYCDLRGVNFDGATMKNTYIEGAILDDSSFNNALIQNLSIDGASAENWDIFSKKQQSELCRAKKTYENFGQGNYLSWRLTLMEQWPSSKYSTGYEFDPIEIIWGFKNFGESSVPVCDFHESEGSELPVFFSAGRPDIRIFLDRAYFGKAGRYTSFRKRVKDHLEKLNNHLTSSKNFKN